MGIVPTVKRIIFTSYVGVLGTQLRKLMSIGEEEASEILKHLGPKAVPGLGEAMATMSNIDKGKATGVLQNFNTITKRKIPFNELQVFCILKF